MTKLSQTLLAAAALALLPCSVALASQSAIITEMPFGETAGGEPIDQYTLTNTQGMTIKILNFGGILRTVEVPDRNGKLADVTLGFDTINPYFKNSPYFGALIGRYGNRIAKGQFSLNGQTYHLFINNGPNSLHGGQIGYNKVLWDATPLRKDGEVGLNLHYSSPDGEEGYPGNLDVNVTYTLTNSNVIRIEYNASTDADTVINLTNHAYWNLSGQNKGKILNTIMKINANSFTPTDSTQIPTGEIRNVTNTPFDFRKPAPLGWRINAKDTQLKIGSGYDHNWILSKPAGSFGQAAQAIDPVSGRVLSVYTDQPGVQLYTGNFLEGVPPGKGGMIYHKNYGFAMETQHYPDSPNHDNFPSTELKPGQTYHTVTEYRFSTTSSVHAVGTSATYKWIRRNGRLIKIKASAPVIAAVATAPVIVPVAKGPKPGLRLVHWHGKWLWVPQLAHPKVATPVLSHPKTASPVKAVVAKGPKPGLRLVHWHGKWLWVPQLAHPKAATSVKPIKPSSQVISPKTNYRWVRWHGKLYKLPIGSHPAKQLVKHAHWHKPVHTGHWVWVPNTAPKPPVKPTAPILPKKPGN